MMMSFGEPNPKVQESWEAILRRLVLPGGLVTAVAFYLYELATRNPGETFGLLRAFGSWFFLALVVVLAGWDLAGRLLDKLDKLGDAVKEGAEAIQRLAAKDDRQAEEIQLIAQFNAQNGEKMLDMMAEQGRRLEAIVDRLDRMGMK